MFGVEIIILGVLTYFRVGQVIKLPKRQKKHQLRQVVIIVETSNLTGSVYAVFV